MECDKKIQVPKERPQACAENENENKAKIKVKEQIPTCSRYASLVQENTQTQAEEPSTLDASKNTEELKCISSDFTIENNVQADPLRKDIRSVDREKEDTSTSFPAFINLKGSHIGSTDTDDISEDTDQIIEIEGITMNASIVKNDVKCITSSTTAGKTAVGGIKAFVVPTTTIAEKIKENVMPIVTTTQTNVENFKAYVKGKVESYTTEYSTAVSVNLTNNSIGAGDEEATKEVAIYKETVTEETNEKKESYYNHQLNVKKEMNNLNERSFKPEKENSETDDTPQITSQRGALSKNAKINLQLTMSVQETSPKDPADLQLRASVSKESMQRSYRTERDSSPCVGRSRYANYMCVSEERIKDGTTQSPLLDATVSMNDLPLPLTVASSSDTLIFSQRGFKNTTISNIRTRGSRSPTFISPAPQLHKPTANDHVSGSYIPTVSLEEGVVSSKLSPPPRSVFEHGIHTPENEGRTPDNHVVNIGTTYEPTPNIIHRFCFWVHLNKDFILCVCYFVSLLVSASVLTAFFHRRLSVSSRKKL